MQQIDLGSAKIEPSGPVVAGSTTTIVFTYTAGHPVDDTGFVKIAFRFAGDFGIPQFQHPAQPNFCSVRTTGNCRIEPRFDPKGHTRPWGRSIHLKIMGGYLDRGEQVTVVFGDTSAGSPGWRMQTFCEETFEFKTLVDPIATYEFKELAESPVLPIVAGRPALAVCIAPSQVRTNIPFTYFLKLEDQWGNPTAMPMPMTHPGFREAGIFYIEAADQETGLSARSNPVRVLDAPSSRNHYWADFHGQSEETIGTNSIEDYFGFARDYARVDICAHQGNDFQVTDEFWETINRTTKKYYRPGSFVTFPGYEWSGNTPLGGDRNVYFETEGGMISRSCTDLLPAKASAFPDSPTAAALFKNLKSQKGPKPFAFAHVGGRYADMGMHDAEIELAVEVHSAWGTFPWLVEDALRLGYRIGICANSDGHKGRPGASYPGAGKFGSLGGYTCVLAEKLDRGSILEALRARRFYATTGNRSLLDVRVATKAPPQALMGDEVETDGETPWLEGHVAGTGPVERVEIRNGLKTVGIVRPYARADLGRRVKIVWSGAQVRGRDRMTSWDGSLHITENRILEATPINFWNPEQPIERIGEDRVCFKSVTTGGVAGMILTLESPDEGILTLKTRQRSVRLSVKTAAMAPKVWECGGLGKRIEIYRLPDRLESHTLSFRIPLEDLESGENPVYIHMVQEDGHMAWSSPIYVVKSP